MLPRHKMQLTDCSAVFILSTESWFLLQVKTAMSHTPKVSVSEGWTLLTFVCYCGWHKVSLSPDTFRPKTASWYIIGSAQFINRDKNSQYADQTTRRTDEESLFDCPQGQQIHLLSKASRPALEPTQTPTQPATEENSLRVNWLEREANHSPLTYRQS